MLKQQMNVLKQQKNVLRIVCIICVETADECAETKEKYTDLCHKICPDSRCMC